jgi:hypothetical protein
MCATSCCGCGRAITLPATVAARTRQPGRGEPAHGQGAPAGRVRPGDNQPRCVGDRGVLRVPPAGRRWPGGLPGAPRSRSGRRLDAHHWPGRRGRRARGRRGWRTGGRSSELDLALFDGSVILLRARYVVAGGTLVRARLPVAADPGSSGRSPRSHRTAVTG